MKLLIKFLTLQSLAWAASAFFLLVVVITNVPAFNDAQGYNFGLYKIDPIDNLFHIVTAIAAALCALYSARASKWFFLIFGVLYGLDALCGLFLQRGLLDFTVFTMPGGVSDFGIRNILVNAPHVVISTGMIGIGIILGKKVHSSTK